MTRNRFRITDRLRTGSLVALACLALATLSCSVIIDPSSKQCTVNADCAKLGAAFEGSVCLKNVCTKQCTVDDDCSKLGAAFAGTVCQDSACVTPVADPLVCKAVDAGTNQTVKLTFTIGFTAVPSDPGMFEVLACGRLDVDCMSPVAGPVSVNAGVPVELDVPVGFQGYLQVTNPSTVPSLEFLARPLQQDTAGWDLTIATPDTVTTLGLATQTKIDTTLGTVIMIARDCNRVPLAGVEPSIQVTQGSDTDAGPDATVSFILVNTFPSKSQMVTTSEGAAGFVNVPLGSAALSGTVVDTAFALSPTSAVSRSGWISYVEVQP